MLAEIHSRVGTKYLKAPRSLSGQFALTGGLVMLFAMTLAGFLSSSIVTKATVENTASSTALFMDSFLSPHLQGLADSDVLAPETIAALDRLLGADTGKENAFQDRFPHLEIWNAEGRVIYSRSPELIGRTFAPPAGLAAALSGQVAAQFADLAAAEHAERQFDRKYLEIYIPVREHLSGRIVAVAEIHEKPDLLEQRLFPVRLMSWLTTGALTLLVMLSLFGIVYRGSRLIDRQQVSLRQRIDEVKQISNQNRKLREKAEQASSRLAELNASYLRHVGAELHDGPAQLIGLASLKVEHVRKARNRIERANELKVMDTVLADALRDIRTISKGLMLPEIEDLQLGDVVKRAVTTHEARTSTKVEVSFGKQSPEVSHAVKICVYRFVQEGLSNAVRHAGSEGNVVSCGFENSVLSVSVLDRGGALDGGLAKIVAGLGLTGLRERVESLGGTFQLARTADNGTCIEMKLAIGAEAQDG